MIIMKRNRSSLSPGWLVDITGSYMATFFLSGAAMLASALVLSTVTGIQRCQRQQSAVTKDSKHDPFPLRLATQSECCIAFNKAAGQAVVS